MNFYEILGVKNTDNIQTIKKAYKRLASKYHPDKNPGDETFTEKFKEINGAYEVLSDPEKRLQYDNSLNGMFGGFSSGGRSPSFNDIWGICLTMQEDEEKPILILLKTHLVSMKIFSKIFLKILLEIEKDLLILVQIILTITLISLMKCLAKERLALKTLIL